MNAFPKTKGKCLVISYSSEIHTVETADLDVMEYEYINNEIIIKIPDFNVTGTFKKNEKGYFTYRYSVDILGTKIGEYVYVIFPTKTAISFLNDLKDDCSSTRIDFASYTGDNKNLLIRYYDRNKECDEKYTSEEIKEILDKIYKEI